MDEYKDEDMDMEEEGEEEESYVPLNWDKLSSNPAVWEVIKEEMTNKFEAECLMKIITAAKEQNMKDKDIFLPIMEEEVVSPFDDSVGNSLED